MTFLYEVQVGATHRSYGFNVARLANVSAHVISLAGEQSSDRETKTKGKRIGDVAPYSLI